MKMYHKDDRYNWIPTLGIGHGKEVEENYIKTQTTFQIDQIDPILPQDINFNAILTSVLL